MELTAENYYDNATSFDYMSTSLYKDFRKCEAFALAKLNGEYMPIMDPTALLVGNYVHSYFESEASHSAFIEKNKDAMMTKSGALRAPYKVGDNMIKCLEADQVFNNLYSVGEKEVIVTGDIFGHQWKGKIDSLNLDKQYFCDIKTTADIHKGFWDKDERRKVPFIKEYGYYLQMAVYTELIKQTFGVECQPFIFAVSKQTPCDHDAFSFNSEQDQEYLKESLEDVKEHQDHIADLIAGRAEPERCGHCEYCRATKQITAFTSAADIEVE